jgi:hypothetical protein
VEDGSGNALNAPIGICENMRERARICCTRKDRGVAHCGQPGSLRNMPESNEAQTRVMCGKLFDAARPTYEKGGLIFFPVVDLSQKRVRCERAARVARRHLGCEPQLEEDVHMT